MESLSSLEDHLRYLVPVMDADTDQPYVWSPTCLSCFIPPHPTTPPTKRGGLAYKNKPESPGRWLSKRTAYCTSKKDLSLDPQQPKLRVAAPIHNPSTGGGDRWVGRERERHREPENQRTKEPENQRTSFGRLILTQCFSIFKLL